MITSNHHSLSQYNDIANLNEEHNIYLVQHKNSKKIFVKKILGVYNYNIYKYMHMHPLNGSPHIIELFEENNTLTIIEEYISGDTLEEKIQSYSLCSHDIENYLKELCTILNALHSLNPPIIHRDIKPSNIIITSHNHVVLLDFNAAKHFTNAGTPDTVLLGTMGYAAPEQYGFGSSTQQTDIYAIGILLKELVASLSVPTNQFNSIIKKCTQINPTDRYKSISALEKEIYPKSNYSLVPPGFRTKNPRHMLISSVVYLLVFWVSFSLNITSTSATEIFEVRLLFFLMFLSIIAGSCNYLNIQKMIPLCLHKNPLVKLFGILLLDCLLLFIVFFSIVLFSVLLSLT